MHISRRRFAIFAASCVSAASLPASSKAAVSVLSENDPTAQSLGYRRNAVQVDRTRFPRYQSGEACANCEFYRGTAGSEMGPCAIYRGKLVNAKGSCNAYAKKT